MNKQDIVDAIMAVDDELLYLEACPYDAYDEDDCLWEEMVAYLAIALLALNVLTLFALLWLIVLDVSQIISVVLWLLVATSG